MGARRKRKKRSMAHLKDISSVLEASRRVHMASKRQNRETRLHRPEPCAQGSQAILRTGSRHGRQPEALRRRQTDQTLHSSSSALSMRQIEVGSGRSMSIRRTSSLKERAARPWQTRSRTSSCWLLQPPGSLTESSLVSLKREEPLLAWSRQPLPASFLPEA